MACSGCSADMYTMAVEDLGGHYVRATMTRVNLVINSLGKEGVIIT